MYEGLKETDHCMKYRYQAPFCNELVENVLCPDFVHLTAFIEEKRRTELKHGLLFWIQIEF